MSEVLARPGTAGSPAPLRGPAVNVTPDLVERFRAMACDVTLRVVEPTTAAAKAVARARAVFEHVEHACTRFDAASPLMQANVRPEDWHVVPAELYFAVREAAAAHRATAGRFDPRVLRALQQIGYDRSLPFAAGPVTTTAGPDADETPETTAPWRPELDRPRRAIRLGPAPIDLGGIGKGLAVRWAADRLASVGRAVLVEAGGDCYLRGDGPEGAGWRIGVEDPRGGTAPLAVLTLADLACATSSIKLRRWVNAGRTVHHLIDPRTGAPGGDGLLAVTVVGADPALAEVWSKALFLEGLDGIERLARVSGLAALWVADDGALGTTPDLDELVIWRADRAG
jgi:thiamine biosynthesis lipoprotein